MPTLQELLSSKNPDQLQSLLDSIKGNPQSESPAFPGSAPTPPPGPTVEPTKDPMVDDSQSGSKLDFGSNFNPDLQKLMDTYKSLPQQQDTSQPEALDDNGMGGVPGSQVFNFHAPVSMGPPEPTQGMGPMANPKDYHPGVMYDQQFGPPSDLASPQAQTMPAGKPGAASHPDQAALMAKMAAGPQGFTNNTVANLKSAQDAEMQQKADSNFQRAINQISAGLIGKKSKANVTPNNTLQDAQDKIAEQNVQNFKDLTEKEKDDPNSTYSTEFRSFVSPLLKELGMNPSLVQNASAAQIKELLPFTQKMFDARENREARVQAAKERSLDRNAQLKMHENDKLTASQNQAFMNTRQILEANRGNPAVQQAETTIANAQKLKSLFKGNDKDLNNINPQMMKLGLMEVAKMALGTQPTQGEIDKLNSGALPERFAGVWQQISNKPQPANGAEFIKQYLKYANQLEKDAQNVIHEKYGRVIESGKGHISSSDYDQLQKQYIDRFKNNEHSEDLQPGQEVREFNGKKYLVDHNTQKVLKEL